LGGKLQFSVASQFIQEQR